MLYEVYSIIKALLWYDSYYHTAKRILSASKIAGDFGLAMIEYGKQKAEVIWEPQLPTDYIERIIKVDPNYYKNKIL